MDGGIRPGSDIIKALCLDARAVLIGRAYAYGMAAGGYPGIERVISILRADRERTFRLLGCQTAASLNLAYVAAPADWSWWSPSEATLARWLFNSPVDGPERFTVPLEV